MIINHSQREAHRPVFFFSTNGATQIDLDELSRKNDSWAGSLQVV